MPGKTVALLAVAFGVNVPAPRVLEPPPPVPREFRAAWATPIWDRGFRDWPSVAGLSPDSQRAELRAMLDHAAAIGLNARDSPRAARRRRAVSDARTRRGRRFSPESRARRRVRRTIRSLTRSRRRTRADSNCTRGSIRSARCCRSSPARRPQRTSLGSIPSGFGSTARKRGSIPAIRRRESTCSRRCSTS